MLHICRITVFHLTIITIIANGKRINDPDWLTRSVTVSMIMTLARSSQNSLVWNKLSISSKTAEAKINEF